MKKRVIITVLFSVMIFSGCRMKNEKSTEAVSTAQIEESDVKPSELSSTSELDEVQSSPQKPSEVTPSKAVNSEDDQVSTDLVNEEYQKVTYEISANLADGMPNYRFVATGKRKETDEWSVGYVLGLEVYDDNGLSILAADFSQTFDGELVGNPVYHEMMDTMGLHVSDVNFDGYKDVIILNDFSGAHGNTWYHCWLWNSETSEFVKSESFAEICNPSLDQENKNIYSTGGSGASYQLWDIYQFMDGEFVVMNRLSCEITNDGYHFIEQKLVNGDLETLRDDVLQADSYDEALSTAGYINDMLWKLGDQRWYAVGGHQADAWLE